jgi:hypothetical protein
VTGGIDSQPARTATAINAAPSAIPLAMALRFCQDKKSDDEKHQHRSDCEQTPKRGIVVNQG